MSKILFMSIPNFFEIIVTNKTSYGVTLQNIISQTSPTNADVPLITETQTLANQLFVTVKTSNNLLFNNWSGVVSDATAPNYIENQIPFELSNLGINTDGCSPAVNRAKVYTADMQYFMPLTFTCATQPGENMKMVIVLGKPVKNSSSGLSTTAVIIIVVVCLIVLAALGGYFYVNRKSPQK